MEKLSLDIVKILIDINNKYDHEKELKTFFEVKMEDGAIIREELIINKKKEIPTGVVAVDEFLHDIFHNIERLMIKYNCEKEIGLVFEVEVDGKMIRQAGIWFNLPKEVIGSEEPIAKERYN